MKNRWLKNWNEKQKKVQVRQNIFINIGESLWSVRQRNLSFTSYSYIICSLAYLRFCNGLSIGILGCWFLQRFWKKVRENPPGTSKVFFIQVHHVNHVLSTGPSIYRIFTQTIWAPILTTWSFVVKSWIIAFRNKATLQRKYLTKAQKLDLLAAG